MNAEIPFGRPQEIEPIYNQLPASHKQQIDLFLSKLITEKYSAETIKQYTFFLVRFYDYTHKSIHDITKEQVDLFLKKISLTGLSNKPLKNTSLRCVYSCLNTFFAFHGKKELMLRRKSIRGVQSEEINTFSTEERDKFFQKTEEFFSTSESPDKGLKWRALFEFSYWEALRVSELINMKVKNIDFVKNLVFIEKGKGNKEATIQLFKPAKEIIERYMKSREFNSNQIYLFEYLYKRGKNQGTSKKYYVHLIEKNFQRVLFELKMGGEMSFHSLRHSCATHLLKATNSIPIVQKHLRHKQGSNVTLRYLHAQQFDITNDILKNMGR